MRDASYPLDHTGPPITVANKLGTKMETEYRQKQQIGTRLATAKAMPMLEFPHNKKEFPYSFSDNPHIAPENICSMVKTCQNM